MGCAACTQEQCCSEQTSRKSSTSAQQTIVSSIKVDGSYISVQAGAVIGIGGFGVVRSAVKTDTAEHYALKSISKCDLLRRKNGLSSAYLELQTQLCLKRVNTFNQFICDIHYAFQDDRFLYVLTDLCLGGDMRLNLNNMLCRKYTEENAKFYISQVMLAISACHKASILHRDCKPENIVLCSNG
jgi:serine/threonine protein kinase